MAFNFLVFSQEFIQKKGFYGSNRKTKKITDELQVLDFLCQNLADDYSLSKTVSGNDLTQTLNKKGIDLTYESIRRRIIMIQKTFAYLNADIGEKRKILAEKNIASVYQNIFFFGIRCMQKDGIEKWDDIIRSKNAKENLESSLNLDKEVAREQIHSLNENFGHVQMIRDKEYPPTFEGTSGRIQEEIIEQSHRFSLIITDKIHSHISELFNTVNQENEKLKNANNLLETLNSNLKMDLAQTKIIIEAAKEEISRLTEECKNLQKDEVTKQLLEYLRSVDASKPTTEKVVTVLDEKYVHYKTQKNNSGMPPLPTVYEQTGVPVVYSNYFMKKYQDLVIMNRRMAKEIHKRITNICKAGIKTASFEIKTIDGESPNTPYNSKQTPVKKHRITFELFKEKLMFYETFPRSKSPFATCSN